MGSEWAEKERPEEGGEAEWKVETGPEILGSMGERFVNIVGTENLAAFPLSEGMT